MFRTFVLTSLVVIASAAQAETVKVAVPVNGGASLSDRIVEAAEAACGPLARTADGVLLINARGDHAFCVHAAVRTARVIPPQNAMVANK